MNIREAKEELINTVKAYLRRDDTGEYEIPVEKQRPVFLMGPPGIGKTAIVSQAAEELGINLVSYTITHHTRQSAIGLPYISKRTYGGREYSVTDYTMSEILAAVYDRIEQTGIREGILFLDEINCVSETLAPTMLQFLQYKTFGTHRVPDGFVIVTAGNPPEYNSSVRDLDIATLDRVRRINVGADFGAWKEYARKAGVHGAILAYLEIRKDHFYAVKTDLDGKSFVTARGWEDLSRIIRVYEEMEKPVTASLVAEYLENDGIAGDFAAYYELYNRYRKIYRVGEILEGSLPEGDESLARAPFDEKLSLVSLLINSLDGEFRAYAEDEDVEKELMQGLGKVLRALRSREKDAADLVRQERQKTEETIRGLRLTGASASEQIRREHRTAEALRELEDLLRLERTGAPESGRGSGSAADTRADGIRSWFSAREQARAARAEEAGNHLTHALKFLAATFGEGQEIVIFLTGLSEGYYSLRYVSECGNDTYYHYNRLLLLHDRRAAVTARVMSLIGDGTADGGTVGDGRTGDTAEEGKR